MFVACSCDSINKPDENCEHHVELWKIQCFVMFCVLPIPDIRVCQCSSKRMSLSSNTFLRHVHAWVQKLTDNVILLAMLII